MSIADWFVAREKRRYVQAGGKPDAEAQPVAPDGVWVKCDGCRRPIEEGELVSNARVCAHCGHHYAMSAPERIALLVDGGSFEETDAHLAGGGDDVLEVADDLLPVGRALGQSREGAPDA